MVERLKEIDRFKSEFLSNVSHELRMPLTSIIGFSELLLDRLPGDLTQDQEDYVRNMQESGYHLLEIINNLLNLSKLRAGKMEVHFEQFGLVHLLENIKRTVTPLIAKKGLEFSSEVIGDLPEMFSDEGKIKQILLNLLSNAIKFTPGGGSIRVETTPSTINGRAAAEIRVSDTGIGIRPEDKAKIFDEFQQVDASYTRDFPGTGLGLSITKQFVSLIGGEISLESQYGKGSTFKILVPVQAVADAGLTPSLATLKPEVPRKKTTEPAHPQPEGGITPTRSEEDGGPLPRILVVEDDPTVGRLLTLYLTQEGYHVDHAMDGEEAIEKARLLKPFAITLDIMLPRKDGWEVLQRLKQNPDTKDIPIIIVSIIEN
ncbi:MAG TPA: ATP-binding protein, partial [Nitrospiria bacterium]|nr:ATP-binding protein [Nitrospiria bacterium]